VDPALSAEEAVRERQRLSEERERAAGLAFARMRRAILRGWPQDVPRALVLLDVDTEQVTRYDAGELDDARARLDAYDVLAGLEIRPLLEGLGLGLGVAGRRLHELRPAQATLAREGGGPPIAVTLARLLKGSCGIARTWKSDAALDALAARHPSRLLDALEADARDLAALYRYGRLHNWVRFRWYGYDARIPAPWGDWDEWTANAWIRAAAEAGQPLEVVAERAAPGGDPWANAQWCSVYDPPGYLPALVTAQRLIVPTEDVQRLRAACPGAWHAPLPAEAAGPSTAVDEAGGRAEPEEARILRIRVELDLQGVAPPVWRVIEVPAEASFWALHVAIQDAMGWLDYHLHAFEVAGPSGGLPLEIGIPLGELAVDDVEPLAGWTTPVLRYLNPERSLCAYNYDFGDDWRHRIDLEAIAPRDPAATYPRCVGGERACPPEDVGGPWGFEAFLAAIADPAHEEHESFVAWSGGSYDPAAFDPHAVTFDDPGERWVGAFGVG